MRKGDCVVKPVPGFEFGTRNLFFSDVARHAAAILPKRDRASNPLGDSV